MTAREGGGESRPPLTLHAEEVDVAREPVLADVAAARRVVDRQAVHEDHPRDVEVLREERVPVGENDSGEIEVLPDGSVSIPLYEEELVVTRRTVLRERVVIRKEAVTTWERVETALRRERVDVEGDGPAH